MSRQRPRTQIKTSAAKCQKPLLYEKQVRRSRRNYITTRHRYAASRGKKEAGRAEQGERVSSLLTIKK